MKILEVPIYNDDGSVQVTHLVSAEEAQTLLQFAINFLSSVGMTSVMLKQQMQQQQKEQVQQELKFND